MSEPLPRRTQAELLWPAELAIHKAKSELDDMPCCPQLTDAVDLLEQALKKVSGFIDGRADK